MTSTPVAATPTSAMRVLLVAEDEYQYVLTRQLLAGDPHHPVQLEWAPGFDAAVRQLDLAQYDVALVDCCLGAHTGVELLRTHVVQRAGVPMVMLTGDAAPGGDCEAMAAGATGCLVKGDVTAPTLRRVLRHAIAGHRVVAHLGQREGSLRALLEDSSDVILLVDRTGNILFASDSVLHIDGWASCELLGHSLFDRMHPDDVDRGRRVLEACARLAGGRVSVSYRQQHRDGTWRYREATVVNRLTQPGVGAIVITYRDTTERRRSQQEIDYLFDLSPDMITAFDFEGRFVRFNSRWTDVLGYPAEQLRGKPFLPLVHPDDRVATAAALAGLTQGQRVLGFTNRYRAADGSYRWIEWNSSADPDARMIYAIARDQTERRLLQEQLRQAQKMDAVGQLAGGIAHDFNNLLTAIIGFGELTLSQLQPDDPMCGDIQQILNAGHSAASLTNQLLAFSRKQILEPQVLDLNVLVTDTQSLLRRVLGEDVELVIELHDGPCHLNADRGQLEQVIMNLAVNARDAMPAGGTLRVAASTVDFDTVFVAGHPGSAVGPHVCLSFTDTGIGMGPEILARLFEPFFTTKPQGKGTGLGLATVYGIVKQSGGYIGVKSTPGHGATFTASFPAVADAPAVPTPQPVARTTSGTETILFVEDQGAVRDAVRRALQRHGYQVLEASDGHAALALRDAHHGPVHLLLTDIVMPHMSGRELAAAITARDSRTRVLYMTGYADDAIVRNGVLEAGVELLRKPFMPDQLLARVRSVLDQPEWKVA